MDTRYVAAVPTAASHTHDVRDGSDVLNELAKRRIATEVRSHEQESLRLRSLLNTHAPVNRKLPPEILSLIFVHYAAIFQHKQFARFSVATFQEPDKYAHKQIYTWLRVAHVCRHWREVALQCASLWSFLVIDERVPGDVIKTFLGRSQGMPLTVIAHAVHQDWHCNTCVRAEDAFANLNAGAAVLEEAVKRATKLNLYLWHVNYAAFWNRLRGSASRLTSLHIEAVEDDRYQDYLHRGRPPVDVPKYLFNEHRPSLHSLTFTGIGLAWSNVLICASVRTLTIVACVTYSDSGIAADVGDLLGALRCMPNLEVFAIDGMSLPQSEFTQYDLVDLPHLQRLRVPFAQQNSLRLVLHLRLPHDAMIYFTGRETAAHNPDFIAWCTEGIPHLMGGLQAYAMAYNDHREAGNFRLWARAPQRPAPSAPPDASSGADLDEDPAWEEVAAMQPRFRFNCSLASGLIQGLFAGLDTQHFRVLSITQNYLNQRGWLDVFTPLTAVRTLRIQGLGACGLNAVLAHWKNPAEMNQAVDDGHANHPHDFVGFGELLDGNGVAGHAQDEYTPEPLPFPHLRTLRIANADFPISHFMPERGHIWGPGRCRGVKGHRPYGIDVTGLVKCLRVRTERGAVQVTRIDLEECQCWEREQLAPLVGAVSEVWWDGKRLAWNDLGEQISLPAKKVPRTRVIGHRNFSMSDGEDDD